MGGQQDGVIDMRMYDPQHYRVRVQTVCEVGGLISRLTCKQDQ